ncbi:hypothetical protein BCR41DRAFT_177258 [Lobosporangium transversale]|uniref:Chromatin assembly factor 1 subunit A-domain-containing protein n=1 Tax=Lobosporangium transversale TaxID=64571 RepID=A0A1Y2GAT1_9FUNG|nr:hypothetical protein BCR41DRAFT_177258 [Lobosporangium transversale]ORZ05750.1 hypothetical protein BCR41DRAFT_177258 [Lobosporangium transversale]|eukprot:XP_021877237.1 hypothetical protein BCR41DRAFT_177258 [Lobosporangium transversale]
MPPKTASPIKTKTLGDFFTKDDSLHSASKLEKPANNQAMTSTTAIMSAANDTVDSTGSPKSKAKKKANKTRTKEDHENQQPMSNDVDTQQVQNDTPSKDSTLSKGKRTRMEVSVVVPLMQHPQAALATSKFIERPILATEAAPPSSLIDSKEATQSGKPTTSAVSTSGSLTLGGGSSNISKFNKVDTASMFKVRSGKAYITESKLKFSAHPSAIADLYRFHEYRESLQMSEDLSQYTGVSVETDHVEITSIPTKHYGLIAKLVEESELVLNEAAAHIMSTLCPSGFDTLEDPTAPFNAQDGEGEMDVDNDVQTDGSTHEQALVKRNVTTVSTTAIMDAIQAVAQRVNYGVPVSSLPASITVTPSNLSVYRWEVQDIDRYFPSDMKAVVLKRRNKRIGASAALTAWFLGLETKQQEELCPLPITPVIAPGAEGGSTIGKKSRLSLGGESMDVDAIGNRTNEEPLDALSVHNQSTVAAVVDPAVLEAKLKEAEAKKKEAEAKEERRLEKERKMLEKQLEKDQKEAERLQREEIKRKKAEEERLKKEQTSMRFVGFFKPITSSATKKDAPESSAKSDLSAPPLSELFHPFHIKKNTSLAPINQFTKHISAEKIDEALDIKAGKDGDLSGMDVDMDLGHNVPKVAETKYARETVRSLFSRRPQSKGVDAQQQEKKLPRHYKSMTVSEAVRSGLLVQDEGNDISYMLTWKDIPSLRMRLLQFAENYRPAYYGTWSRQSKRITGRRFLGKDTELVDYDFDSEAEWEEDEEGEECKSDDDEEDVEDVGSDQDEEDDWLVPEGYLSEDEGLDAGEEGGAEITSQRKSKEVRRPALSQMTPIIVGPIFETVLGECSTHPVLEAYHVEFLGDYNIGMDMYHAVDSYPYPIQVVE